MPMRNKIKQFLESRGLSAYRMIQDAKISDTTGYKLAADSTYIPSSKILEALCETYRIQPGEILEWFPAEEMGKDS
ncbi:helix-turn-helix domain-containing protein [Nostoc sp. B(2019)]|nr:helix-turn-helix domain-containing protein [Nostoc sp. B(2019)]